MKNSPYRDAWRYYRELYFAGVVYVAAVLGQVWLFDVPYAEFARVSWAILMVAAKCMMLLVGMGAWVFVSGFARSEGGLRARWRSAKERLSKTSEAYLDGEVFAYALMGVPVLFAIDFFFVQKSLIPYLNYYSWDPFFAALDKTLHFGLYPHEFVVPASDALGLGRFYDISYYLWFVVLYLGIGYNLFMDTDARRRLRFYWVFFLTWTVLGSAGAAWFSSVGPLFYHDFYPVLADPYAGLVAHFEETGKDNYPIASATRIWLLHWATNGQMVNVNCLSAMPSMHVAIAWLVFLYGASISRAWMIASFVFCLSILFGSVFFGFHYAVDGYLSIIVVSLMWWGVGKAVDRRYPQDTKPLKRLQDSAFHEKPAL